MNLKNLNKKYVIFILLILGAVSLLSYYFGAYSYYYKIFPFNPDKSVKEKKNNLVTAYYDLSVSRYNLPIHAKYGGIDVLNDKIIYMSDNSEMYVFEKNNENIYNFKKN